MDGTTKWLYSLRCVFISHMHADHHLGLVTIIRQYYRVHVEEKKSVEGHIYDILYEYAIILAFVGVVSHVLHSFDDTHIFDMHMLMTCTCCYLACSCLSPVHRLFHIVL